MQTLYKIAAFVRRDYLIMTSYKMAVFVSLIGAIFPILSYFFVGKLVNHDVNVLAKYGGDYFSFTLVGISFTTYFTMALQEFSGSMRRAQMAGCLEAILSSQTGPKSVVFMSAIFSFIFYSIVLLIMFIVAIVFLNFDITNINVGSTVIALVLSFFTFVSLGIFSGAGTVLFKQGEPFGFLFGTLSSLLGGAVFPVEVLPDFLQPVSYLIPITYALDALRLSILQGHSPGMLVNDFAILASASLILLPLSLVFFQWAVEKGKKDGTLMQY